MSYSLSPDEVARLFKIGKPTELQAFLNDIENKAKGKWKWRSLGDRVANASNIHVLTESGPGIVERITNGIDAMLELKHRDVGSPVPGPTSPRSASEQWFGIIGGTLNRDKDDQAINGLAPNVRVDIYDSGQPKRPSVSITDCGIGQHPYDLPSTTLSLGESNKIGRTYLCGAYGQGGSATFAWCEYSIIVSRRRPEHADGRPDLVGWTIVRRYDDINLKLYTYQYLITENGEIPTFSPSALTHVNFDFGTYVIHIAYELGWLSALVSLVGYRYLNNLLFDPVLPYTIHDHREPKPQDRYMYGSRGRLTGAPIEYKNEYIADLGTDGILKIRYWVFHEKKREGEEEDIETGVNVDSYLEARGSSHTVVVTLNGQRHAFLDKSFMRNVVRYPLVSETLLVQVDCDQLSRQRKKDLFPATRSGIVAGERRMELIEKALQQALDGDKELNRLEQERVQKRLATVDAESEQKVKRLLDQLITISRPLLGIGADIKGGAGQVPTGPEKFKPNDPPTYFKFAEEKQELHILAGHKHVIDIVTDGPNDMLTRKTKRGLLTLEAVGNGFMNLYPGSLYNGRMGVAVATSSEANVGASCQLRATLEMDGGVFFASYRSCKIVAPPPPYVGQEPPKKLVIKARGNVVRLRQGRVSQVTVETDCKDDILSRPINAAHFEVETSIPGILLTARRGPHRGQIEAFLTVPGSIKPTPEQNQNNITARLVLSDDTILQDTKPCAVVEPPPPDQEKGKKPRPKANYEIIEVWQEPPEDSPSKYTWAYLDWNQTNVGRYDLTRNGEGNDFLLLYINMDNEDLTRERERRLRKSGEAAKRRLDVQYKAYIGYHMWLHQQRNSQDKPTSGVNADKDLMLSEETKNLESVGEEEVLQDELSRVAKTVILAMRSTTDIFSSVAQEEFQILEGSM